MTYLKPLPALILASLVLGLPLVGASAEDIRVVPLDPVAGAAQGMEGPAAAADVVPEVTIRREADFLVLSLWLSGTEVGPLAQSGHRTGAQGEKALLNALEALVKAAATAEGIDGVEVVAGGEVLDADEFAFGLPGERAQSLAKGSGFLVMVRTPLASLHTVDYLMLRLKAVVTAAEVTEGAQLRDMGFGLAVKNPARYRDQLLQRIRQRVSAKRGEHSHPMHGGVWVDLLDDEVRVRAANLREVDVYVPYVLVGDDSYESPREGFRPFPLATQ